MKVMTLTKAFRFYAAHRNQEIGGKCSNIHGHRYTFKATVMEKMVGSITILFQDLEDKIQPLIDELDHSLLLDVNDPAGMTLGRSGACDKLYLMNNPTSAENLATDIFKWIEGTGLNIVKLELQETDSTTITIELK
jgi:6-pyruvoyltetrahydropterin/6-carboxytetrahydropterin synthase